MSLPSPKWRVPPPSGWYIEAIKHGILRGTLELHFSTLPHAIVIPCGSDNQFRIGRDDQQCEIGISSRLASRVHAVVHFKRVRGDVTLPYIYDW